MQYAQKKEGRPLIHPENPLQSTCVRKYSYLPNSAFKVLHSIRYRPQLPARSDPVPRNPGLHLLVVGAPEKDFERSAFGAVHALSLRCCLGLNAFAGQPLTRPMPGHRDLGVCWTFDEELRTLFVVGINFCFRERRRFFSLGEISRTIAWMIP